jgi:DNA-directed RNA polymerase subunit RPC12/RpoP
MFLRTPENDKYQCKECKQITNNPVRFSEDNKLENVRTHYLMCKECGHKGIESIETTNVPDDTSLFSIEYDAWTQKPQEF